MRSIVRSAYLDSAFGTETELNAAGTSLENPFVYDSAARELKTMAEAGLVEIISERYNAPKRLIERITFARLR